MQRPITGFGRDAEYDWFAVLDCGHRQHVRHRPPFFNRPWVMTAAGRNERLGRQLDCVLCDRFELPDTAQPDEQTAAFTQTTLPSWLHHDHASQAGIWTVIRVTEGRLRTVFSALDCVRKLKPGTPGIVPPQVRHRLEPLGPVSFHLVTYRIRD